MLGLGCIGALASKQALSFKPQAAREVWRGRPLVESGAMGRTARLWQTGINCCENGTSTKFIRRRRISKLCRVVAEMLPQSCVTYRFGGIFLEANPLVHGTNCGLAR
jgi:hypothetical protein